MPARRWWPWLALWTAVGLGIRLGTVFGRPGRVAGGDAYYNHNAANLLVAGQGFINPFLYYPHGLHHHVQTASWPPLFVFVLAAASLVGAKSFFAQRIWCCIIGAGGIVLCGYVGREIGGRRVGLIAAMLVAVYPNIWMSDELALSETLSPVLVALVLLTAYRFWKRPGLWNVVWLGASIGLAALGRDELSLLAVFILVPLALLAKTLTWWRRIALLGIGGLVALLLVAPWVGYNMSRFSRPRVHQLRFRRHPGFGQLQLHLQRPVRGVLVLGMRGGRGETFGDEAPCGRVGPRFRGASPTPSTTSGPTKTGCSRWRWLGSAAPSVSSTRSNRSSSTPGWRPAPTTGRSSACSCTTPSSLLSVGGVIILRRRRIPVFPLLAIGLDVAISVALTFGQTRYRSTFEVSLVLLASVQLDWFWSRLRRRAERGRPRRRDRGRRIRRTASHPRTRRPARIVPPASPSLTPAG